MATQDKSKPADVFTVSNRLMDAGIASLMLQRQPFLPKDPRVCTFWVIAAKDEIQVVVEFPPHGHTIHFDAHRGESFGPYGSPPLSDAQMTLVEELATDWQAERQSTT